MPEAHSTTHGAVGPALGFYYQTLFALETLVTQTADDAAVAVERLDDVDITANGHSLLYQLKHSIQSDPPPVTLKAKPLWRTMKVWIDLLPLLSLQSTTFHLVAVGGVADASPLQALSDLASDRTDLTAAMVDEANRVVRARAAATSVGKALPHGDRADGCEAFLGLERTQRDNLMRRILVRRGRPIDEIEPAIAAKLLLIPVEQRTKVAARLVEWWDRQVVLSLCGLRDRSLTRIELQRQIMSVVAELEDETLVPQFEVAIPPRDYQPAGMLSRQITLVDGKTSDLTKAIREEWRAREQRARWTTENPSMADTLHTYDLVLQEHWHDRHSRMVETCALVEEAGKCAAGLALLRWTHDEAPSQVRPIAERWSSPYLVRGSYQVLAINLAVGWHPDFAKRLEDVDDEGA